MFADHGAIAQLVEHLHGMQGVRSSSLLGSILKIIDLIYVAREGHFFWLLFRFFFSKELSFGDSLYRWYEFIVSGDVGNSPGFFIADVRTAHFISLVRPTAATR